jgi:transposase InsO family protein
MVDHLRTHLAPAALQMALTTRRPEPGLIHHADRGGQYTSSAYRELLHAHQVRQSVGHPGTCWDNSVAESFFATLKTELLYRHACPTRRHAELAIFEFIAGWYSEHRRHSILGHLSPADVERCTPRVTFAA